MKVKRKYLVIIGILVVLVIIGFIFIKNPEKTHKQNPVYLFKGDTLNYSQDRGKPDYQISLKSVNDSINIYSVNFTSRQFINYTTRIFGLLFMPSNHTDNLPGLVFLPGGGVSKDQKENFGIMIAQQGYAVLIIDQRGIGQTGGYYLSFQDDFGVFANGYEPIQHLSVYDGLAAFDVLKEIKGVNQNNIAISGESMGGRYAIIAAALDDRLKGVIVISSSGFHIAENLSNPAENYMVSIDPDHYIGMIQPRYTFMLQGDNDTTVALQDAEFTYSLAGNPKSFFIAKGQGHGYSSVMQPELFKDLKSVFSL